MRFTAVASAAVAAAVTGAAPPAARADVTLTYVGTPYQYVSDVGPVVPPDPPGPYTKLMKVGAQIVVADPLAANLVDQAITMVSFKIYDGLSVYTGADSTASLRLWTDAEGDITSWRFYDSSNPTPIEAGVTKWRRVGSD